MADIIDFDPNRQGKRPSPFPDSASGQSIQDLEAAVLREMSPGLAEFDFSDLPDLTVFHWETTEEINFELEEIRKLFLFRMSEENREYFWNWTDGRFWSTVADTIIAGYSDYFFEKVRKLDVPITDMASFQTAFFCENPSMPGLDSPTELTFDEWGKAYSLWELHFNITIPEGLREVFEDFHDANFWLLTEWADGDVFLSAHRFMASEVERPLPPLVGGTEGQNALATKIRSSRVAFFDDRTYEFFKNRTDATFWLLNYRAPLVSYRYQATGQSKPRGATHWLNMNAGRAPTPKPKSGKNRPKRR